MSCFVMFVTAVCFLFSTNQTSLRIKIPLNYQLKSEVSWANFHTNQRIFNWQPFMNRVYQDPLL